MSFSLSQPPFWLYILYLILVMTTAVHILYQRRSPQNLTAWLLTLLLLPFIGVLLYVVFGSRKFLYKHPKPPIEMQAISLATPENELASHLNELLAANKIAGATNGNQVEIYQDANSAFSQFMQALEQAQSSIHLQTYIFELDATGTHILEALIRKARQGVEVRLLLDSVGSFSLYRNPNKLKELRQAGGQYAFFHPLLHSFFKSQINLRNHRKIYLFDQTNLLTGGMNLSSEYLGVEKLSHHYWIDLMFKIQGPCTFHYQNLFNQDWHYATAETLPAPTLPKPQQFLNGDIIQAVPSGPDIASDALFETLLQSIYLAKESIQIVTPYFIPDSSIMNALIIAIKRGVKVTLITPLTSDHLIFDLGRGSYMRELSEIGAAVFYYQPSMLHAKLVIIDQNAMMIGTANFDYRSLFINHEIVNFIYAKPLITQMQLWLETLLKQSQPYQLNNNRLKRLFENLTRIIAPVL